MVIDGGPTVVFDQTFDTRGNRESVSTSINAGNGFVKDFQNAYTFDALSQMTGITQVSQEGGHAVAPKQIDLAYNALGQFTSIDRKLNDVLVIHSTYSYDSLARLANIAHQDGAATPATLAGYAYSYDRLDRITSITSTIDGLSTFDYDATSQLIAADHASQTDEVYDWDANGNPDAANFTLGVNNRVYSDGTFNYLYDQEGHRISRERISSDPADDHRLEYTWNHRDQLVKVVHKDNSGAVTRTIAYEYDVFGRIFTKRRT